MKPPCILLDWDSEFFGFRIARLPEEALDPKDVDAVDTWCRKNEISCLYFLSRSDDAATLRLAQERGFRLVDVRQTFEREQSSDTPQGGGAQEGLLVRAASSADVTELRAVARTSHRASRFYADPGFPRPLADSLYETWIERSCEGYADRVLVGECDGIVSGYTSCHLESSDIGRIGLVGVAPRARGRSLGPMLVHAALTWFRDQGVSRVEVATQASNLAAQRLYQRCGFLTREVQLWFHKWYLIPHRPSRSGT